MENMFYGMIFFREDMSYRRIFLMGGHLLLENMSCLMGICLTGGHVLLEACLKRGHVFENMFFRRMFL